MAKPKAVLAGREKKAPAEGSAGAFYYAIWQVFVLTTIGVRATQVSAQVVIGFAFSGIPHSFRAIFPPSLHRDET